MECSSEQAFIDEFSWIALQVFNNAKEHGFWESKRNDGEMIALMHSELSEALEAIRQGDRPSEHIPRFSSVEEEMADVVIRIMDMCKGRGWRVAEAIIAKHKFNCNRPYKHGKKF